MKIRADQARDQRRLVKLARLDGVYHPPGRSPGPAASIQITMDVEF